MTTVGFIVTGTLEHLALPDAMQALFPDIYFVAEYLDGFTSSSAEPNMVDKRHNAYKMVERADARLSGFPPTREMWDFAVILEDVELVNQANVADILAVVQKAAAVQLGPTPTPATQQRLQTQISFHLANPMIEAWFFPDQMALERANLGPPLSHQARLQPKTIQNPEDFETNDALYAAENGACCSEWTAVAANYPIPLIVPKKQCDKHMPLWLHANRHRHPKHYLAWLCKDTGEKACSRYKESKGGADALRALDWTKVLSSPSSCPYLAALVDDLSYMLNRPPNLQVNLCAAGRALTCYNPRRPLRQGTLRNI